jgi:bifunctional polynucleotide phosphatase/kinase
MSNQSGISLRADPKGPKNLDKNRFIQFKQKAGAVFNSLNLPIGVYAATENDIYRKPRMGMWNEFLKDNNLHAADIDFKDSVFVGDAGGRPATQRNDTKIRADFSCSDR